MMLPRIFTLIMVGILLATGSGMTCSADPEQDPVPAIAPLNPDYLNYLNLSGGDPGSDNQGTAADAILMPPSVSWDHLKGDMSPETVRGAYPESYDLRTLGRVPAIRDQGSYKTDWVFSALGSFESHMMPKKTLNFSEKNMVNRNLWYTSPNSSGSFLGAEGYLLGWFGPVDESIDPYPDNSGWNYISPAGPVSAHVQDVSWIPSRNNPADLDTIKGSIIANGAMETYMYWNSSNYNSSTAAYYSPFGLYFNYAGDIVGWNDTFSRYNFTEIPGGDGAFLFRMSRGDEFGDGGYVWVSYYDSRIGIYNQQYIGSYPGEYSGIYQHDPAGLSGFIGYYAPDAWGANLYTADSDAELSAVGFYVNDIPVSYGIRIYRDPVIGPIGPVMNSQQNGTFTMPGYHTVQLETPVRLAKGQKFSVVLNVTNADYQYPIGLEMPAYGPEGNTWTAGPGEGYLSRYGDTWRDITDNYPNVSLCIKGYTKSLYDINASHDPWSIVSPSGTTSYPEGADKTYLTEGKPGADLTGVYIDDDSLEPVSEISDYPFIDIKSNHTISVTGTPSSGQVHVFFNGLPLTGTAPLDVQFHDQSLGSPDSWFWQFGDGKNSTDKDPLHRFTQAGTYSVSLRATNNQSAGEKIEAGYVTVTE